MKICIKLVICSKSQRIENRTAVNKASSLQQVDNKNISTPIFPLTNTLNKANIFIKGDRKYHQIALADICYLESYGSYVKIYLADQMILTHETTTHFEKILPKSAFLRVHKSYIVAIPKIETIEGNQIKIKDKMIPIGNFYKKEVQRLIKG